MSDTENISSKTFISYSWGTSEHNDWVTQLATELVENFGIDVIFDKWDLRENDDKYVFMEKAVVSPETKKVLMICDKNYQQKADDRKGGVGTETQIISNEVYQMVKSDEDKKHKFCAIIKERDENGKPYIPTYLKSRIYIDMSTEELRDQNLEQLVRWIYDKPLEKKPALGKPPNFLFEEEKVSLRTSSLFRLANNAIKQNKPNAFGLVRDYLETFASNFEELRLTPLPETHFDDQVIDSIELFLPYRDEYLDLLATIVRYSQNDDYIVEIGNFFERILPYLFVQTSFNSSVQKPQYKYENDNYRFIIRELFLLSITILIKNQKFNWANELLSKQYYLEERISEYRDDKLYSFLLLNQFLESIPIRAERLKIQTNIVLELIQQRTNRSDININDIMQADFVLYLRDELLKLRGGRWFPYSLLHFPYAPFEMFIRSESLKFFNNFKIVLGIDNKEQLATFLDGYDKGEHKAIRIGHFDKVEPRVLSNFERLTTKE